MAALAMSLRGGCIAALVALCAASAGAQPAHDWRSYYNDRFGFRLDYPADLFKPGPPPENGDGLVFRSADGRASIRGSGGFNVLNQSLQDIRAQALDDHKGAALALDRIAGDDLVLSGLDQDTIFYLRVKLSKRGEVVNTLEMLYPRAVKQQFDALFA